MSGGAPFSLIEMLGRAMPQLSIVDVGALWVQGESRPYDPLLKKGGGRVVGFEPVQAECDRLNGLGMKNQTYLPYFIGDGGAGTFYNCKFSQTSSLLEPNMALLRRFQHLAELTAPQSTEAVTTKRLDDIPEIASVDYLKLDVQGAEVLVLRGGERLLQGAVCIHTEVCFAPLYKGQALFAEIDQELRRQGFLFHTFAGMSGRAFKPLAPSPDPSQPFRQLLWGDAVYVRDFTRLSELSA
jgi:FkbM family methyltransferase